MQRRGFDLAVAKTARRAGWGLYLSTWPPTSPRQRTSKPPTKRSGTALPRTIQGGNQAVTIESDAVQVAPNRDLQFW